MLTIVLVSIFDLNHCPVKNTCKHVTILGETDIWADIEKEVCRVDVLFKPPSISDQRTGNAQMAISTNPGGGQWREI